MNRRQRRRRAVIRKYLLAGPPVLLAALWAVGLLLSPLHREDASVSVPASPETVWAILTDLDGMPDWRADLAGLERLPSGDTGVRWREVGSRGRAASFERVEASAPSRLVVRQVGGTGERVWVYQISGSARGVEVSLTEVSRIANPLRRAVAAIFGGDRSRIAGLARDLEKRLNARRQLAAVVKR